MRSSSSWATPFEIIEEDPANIIIIIVITIQDIVRHRLEEIFLLGCFTALAINLRYHHCRLRRDFIVAGLNPDTHTRTTKHDDDDDDDDNDDATNGLRVRMRTHCLGRARAFVLIIHN